LKQPWEKAWDKRRVVCEKSQKKVNFREKFETGGGYAPIPLRCHEMLKHGELSEKSLKLGEVMLQSP